MDVYMYVSTYVPPSVHSALRDTTNFSRVSSCTPNTLILSLLRVILRLLKNTNDKNILSHQILLSVNHSEYVEG